ncbi:MAG: hypothetical protein II877_00330, partial [Synergistaceae bacterium]|nr:hypothetical protein [Synergistaceae bacterium]
SGGRTNSNGTPEPTMHFVSFSGGSASINQDLSSASASAVRTSGVRSAADDLSDEAIKQLASQLKERYESGDTVVLMYPSPYLINKLYNALGEQPTYVEPEEVADDEDVDAEDLYPEMYAFAKRYNGASSHTYTYMLPSVASLMRHAAKFDAEEGEVSEDVAEGTQPEPVLPEVSDPYEGMRGEYVFQARRYLSLKDWSAEIDSVFAEQKAFVASSFKVNAADEPSTKIFDYHAQRESSNFDWKHKIYIRGIGNWYHSRTANTADTIYAFHNFGDECDYYVVQSTGSYYPTGYKRFKDGDWYYTFGAASYFEYRHTLTMDDSLFNLFTNAPRNVNRKSTVTDGSEHSTSSTSGQTIGTKTTASVSASLADGLSASISTELSHERNTSKTKGASYNHSATWETEEWTLENRCNSNAAEWYVGYDSDTPNFYAEYDGIDARTRNNAFDCEWMWQVKDPTQTPTMRITLYDKQLGSKGTGHARYQTSHSDTTYRYVKLTQPPHVGEWSDVRQKREDEYNLQIPLQSRLDDLQYCGLDSYKP